MPKTGTRNRQGNPKGSASPSGPGEMPDAGLRTAPEGDETLPARLEQAGKLDLPALRRSAGEATALLRSLAHEDRLLLLCQLSQTELCVGDIELAVGIRQPTLSQQLGVLRRDGLVATRRDGKHIYYRVADDKALRLLETLYELFCAPEAGVSSREGAASTVQTPRKRDLPVQEDRRGDSQERRRPT